MKKTFTIILTLMLAIAIALSTSGCLITGPIETEKHKQLMLSLLKEKYGEGFKVLTIKYDSSSGFSGGLASGSGHYDAVCCPKSNEEILFEASVCKNGTMISSDDYPHAVVKRLIKEEVERIISKYSDNYALHVSSRLPNSYIATDEDKVKLENVVPFTRAGDISIETYSEKYGSSVYAVVYIIFEGDEYSNAEATIELLNEIKPTLYKMPVKFWCYYTSNEKVIKCKQLVKDNDVTGIDIDQLLKGDYPILKFLYSTETDYEIKYDKENSELR